MHRYAFLLLPLLLALPAGAGGDKFDPEARAKALAPYLDEQTLAVLRIDLARPDAEAVALMIAEIASTPGDPADRKRQVRKWLADFTRAGGKELYLLFGVGDFFDMPLVVAPLGAEAKGKEIAALLSSGTFLPQGQYQQIKGAVVGGNPDALERLRSLGPEPRPDLAKAFAAAGDTPAQLLVVPTADTRRVVEEIMPVLPKEIGGGPSTILTRGVRWAAVGIQGAPKLGLSVVVQSQDAEAARKLRDWLGDALKALGRSKEMQRHFPDFAKVAATVKPNVEGSRLTLKLSEEQVVAILLPLMGRARATAGQQQSSNNLKQIGLAMHSYHDVNKALPPAAIYDKQGKPLLSWRVAILPYLEENALYKEFKRDEPWDSPHNKKLLVRMPKVYRSPFSRKGEEGKTVYLAPLGKDTAFPPERRGMLLPKDFPDGTSNTILIVEATDERAVPWTKPEDLPYNAKDPVAGLLSKDRDWFLAVCADGAVHAVPLEIGLDNIRALFTRNGGEAITKPF
jgi:hypothetical protein